jgi:hypothetical protein
MAQDQNRQKILARPHLSKQNQADCLRSAIPPTWKACVGGLWSKVSLDKKCKTVCKQMTKAKTAGGLVQVVEHLPSKL